MIFAAHKKTAPPKGLRRGLGIGHGQGGYIGPIGDDFPSLIPLIFGLLMFFTAFTITFNAFDTSNSNFNDDITLLRISRTLQSNSYIFSRENFSELCGQVGVVNLKFAAVLSEGWVNPGNAGTGGGHKSIFDVPVFRNAKGDYFHCSNQKPRSTNSLGDFAGLRDVSGSRFVSRIYPIVVEDEKIVKPMHLVVVAWK